MNLDRDIKKYIKRLSRAIPKDCSDRKRLLTDIEENLRQHIWENPSASWNEIIEEFGTADEMAKSLIGISSKSDVLISLRSKKNRYTVLFLLCIAFAIIGIGVVFYMISWESTDHYIRHEPHYILDGTEVTPEEFERKMSVK